MTPSRPSAIPAKVGLLIPKLATDHAGELVATRDAIVRLLSAVGLDLHDLAAAACTMPATRSASTSQATPTWSGPCAGDLARAVRDRDNGRLTPRERAFVDDVVRRGFGFRPSPRQEAWLTAIFDRLHGRAAA